MRKYLRHVREIFLFSIPVVAGKVSEILFGIGDVIVAGRYSTLVLGAMGVASAFLFPILIFGVGVLSAVSSLKARRLGAGECVERFPATSLKLSTLVGLVLTVLTLLISQYIVPLVRYEPEFASLVQTYLSIASLSILPAMIFSGLKELLLARSHTVVPNLMIFLFNFFNVAANVVLMFGLNMGIAGAAVATLLSRTGMALALYLYARRKMRWSGRSCSNTAMEVLRVGVPAGGISMVVASVFAVVAILVGRMSVVAAATNNVLINITSFTFMIPFALSGVTAVKVGHAYGKGDLGKVREYAGASIIIGSSIALIGALLFAFLPGLIIRVFTNQPEVIGYGSVLLLYVAIYQVPDAIQEIFVGALRGIGETTTPFILCFLGIWGIGLTSGCYFAYRRGMDAAGLWLGLSIGLVFLGTFLAGYFLFKMRKLEAEQR